MYRSTSMKTGWVAKCRVRWGVAICLTLGAASGAMAGGPFDHGWWKSPSRVIASGLMAPTGATVGPDGALYVAEGAAGRITRVDPRSGRTDIVAEQLPAALPGVGLGGVMDVAFLDGDLYTLVTLQFGSNVDGIYRITGRTTSEPVADLGLFNLQNPPPPDFDIDLPGGLQFSIDAVDQGLLVTDGHLNRVMHVIPGDPAEISLFKQFGNTVPTGMAGDFGTLYLAMLGSVEFPDDSGVAALGLLQPDNVREVADGVQMIVDVELGPNGEIYALSQGDLGSDVPGAPAEPNTGRLLKVKSDGTFRVLARHLNQPTSLNFVCGEAHVVTLAGDVLRFRSLAGFGLRLFGRCR